MEREVHRGEGRDSSSSDYVQNEELHMCMEEGGQVQQPHLQRPRRKEAGWAQSTAGNGAAPPGERLKKE